MSLENLKPAAGSNQKQGKRLGRGEVLVKEEHQQEVTKEPSPDLDIQKIGFEGGQMPLQRRVPKFDSKHQ